MQPVVLVVEDETLIRWDTCDQLREENFEVLEASSVMEANLILEARQDISVLFTDVQLPGPKSGLDLARDVKKRFPKMLIIVTSGHLGSRQLPKQLGEFIDKPYSTRVLAEKIRTFMRKSATTQKSVGFSVGKLGFQT